MIVAADEGAAPETRAEAWSGVRAIYARVHIPAANQGAGAAGIERKIEAFMRDPRQNTPKPRPSGAPAGPPI